MSAPKLPDVIREGERNAVLTSAAGSMRQAGFSEDAIRAAVRRLNDERCRPPLAAREVDRIAASVAKYEPSMSAEDHEAHAAKLKLNETYAVLQVGGDVVILQLSDAGRHFELMTPAAFRLLLRNKAIVHTRADGKPPSRRPLADAWLEWGERREYARLVFKPGVDVLPPNEFNLWRGWAVAPDAGDTCRLFRRHLKRIVCRGNQAHYDWLLDWLAEIIQHPMRKLGHLVALRGSQGTGKSVVGYMMQQILGIHQTVAEKPQHVIGRFNKHIAYCLLLQAEEAFWGGDKSARGALKHLVTGRDQMIEAKGVDTVPLPNYTRLLITSNEELVWPAEMGDRRLVIFKVSDKRRGDAAYFDALFREIDHGGAGAFLRFLFRRKIEERRLKTPPTTAAFKEQILLAMPPEEAWLHDLSVHGRLPSSAVVDVNGFAHVPIGALYERYLAAVPRGQYAKNQWQFGIFLKSWKTLKVQYAGERDFTDEHHIARQSRGIVLLPLDRWRTRYSARGRGAPKTWTGSARWRVAKA